jgi:hypothetical protein
VAASAAFKNTIATTQGTDMNLHLKHLIASAALAALSASALAQASAPAGTNTPRVDQRQANQEQRIDNGVASGQLTPRETRRLTREQNVVDRAENKAKADGTVTAHERNRLHKMQRHASKDIRHQKHDRQGAASAAGG